MQKNVSGQKLIVYAYNSTTNAPVSGDAANITAYVSKDFGAVTVLGDTSATEMDATNAKGYYLFDLTQAETNGDALLFSAKSVTANVVVLGTPAYVQTIPAAFTIAGGAAGGVFIAGTNAATAITSTVSGTSGLTITGLGAGHGLSCVGTSISNGINCSGGSSGMNIAATSTGTGLIITGGPSGFGGAAGVGVVITGGTAGANGMNITGGNASSGTAGTGLAIVGGNATSATGKLAGTGLTVTGGSGAGATNGAAIGAIISGGGTNTVSSTADGLKLIGTSNGSGLNCILAGTGASITASTITGTLTTVSSVTNPVTVGTINSTATNIKKNTALNAFEFLMTDSTNHLPKTGLSVTATRSLDGAAFGACANAVTEIASGMYTINLATTDMNANVVTLRFTSTGADDSLITIVTQP